MKLQVQPLVPAVAFGLLAGSAPGQSVFINDNFETDTSADYIITDDGSPDGTADIVKRLMTEFTGQLHIHERKGKLGLGTAYIAGFRWALEREYGYIFELDADFSHPVDKLVALYEACAHQRFLTKRPTD